ncbi:YisL family protein [Fructilactobacillus sp. Tb1]|uniref:YisL family protein n=1 Tax=Fructilactobacillus sp. Tb1 TaxID=3422304 RepID=UPI003D29B7AC
MLVNIMMGLWVLLIIPFLFGMYEKQDKTIIKIMLYTRILYLLVLVGDIMLIIRNFKTNPIIDILSFLATVVAISFIDISYQRKIQGNFRPYLIWVTLISIIISITCLFFI